WSDAGFRLRPPANLAPPPACCGSGGRQDKGNGTFDRKIRAARAPGSSWFAHFGHAPPHAAVWMVTVTVAVAVNPWPSLIRYTKESVPRYVPVTWYWMFDPLIVAVPWLGAPVIASSATVSPSGSESLASTWMVVDWPP